MKIFTVKTTCTHLTHIERKALSVGLNDVNRVLYAGQFPIYTLAHACHIATIVQPWHLGVVH